QMVRILAAVLSDGLHTVEAACLEALQHGTHSADVVLNTMTVRSKSSCSTFCRPCSVSSRRAGSGLAGGGLYRRMPPARLDGVALTNRPPPASPGACVPDANPRAVRSAAAMASRKSSW